MFLSDDEDYLPPNKRSKNTETANEAASTGRRKTREFNFGKMKKNSRFVSLYLVSFLSVDVLYEKIRLNVLLN